jgi:ribulose-phosphate 3-epimerase
MVVFLYINKRTCMGNNTFWEEKRMKIVPAILTDKPQDLKLMLAQAETFTDFVQIDFMDGSFVPSKSIGPEDLAEIAMNVGWEAHLMVKDPIRYLPSLKREGLKRVLVHWEAGPRPESFVSAIRDFGFHVGLAINPETTLSQFEELVDRIESVLFLSVDPGFYGSPFIAEVLEKIREFRSRFPSKMIGIDGGISLDNMQRVKSSGVDYACVGSRIFRHDDPRKSYEEFVAAIG